MEPEGSEDKANGYFRVTLRVPLKDVDLFQMVWYGNYLGYFDLARTEFLRRCGLGPPDMAGWGLYAPVVSAEVRYHASAHYDDEIVVAVRPEIHRTAQITFRFRLFRKEDDCLMVSGKTTHVLKTTEGVLMYRIPSVLRERMERILKDLGETREGYRTS